MILPENELHRLFFLTSSFISSSKRWCHFSFRATLFMSPDNIYLEECLCLTRNVVRSVKTLSFHRVLSIFLTLDAMEFDLSSYWRLRSFNWCNTHLVSSARDILALSSVLKFVKFFYDIILLLKLSLLKAEALVCKVWRLLTMSQILLRSCFIFLSYHRVALPSDWTSGRVDCVCAVHERANDGGVSCRVSGSGDVLTPLLFALGQQFSGSSALVNGCLDDIYDVSALDQSEPFCTMTCCSKMGSPTLVLGMTFRPIVGRTNDPSSDSMKCSQKILGWIPCASIWKTRLVRFTQADDSGAVPGDPHTWLPSFCVASMHLLFGVCFAWSCMGTSCANVVILADLCATRAPTLPTANSNAFRRSQLRQLNHPSNSCWSSGMGGILSSRKALCSEDWPATRRALGQIGRFFFGTLRPLDPGHLAVPRTLLATAQDVLRLPTILSRKSISVCDVWQSRPLSKQGASCIFDETFACLDSLVHWEDLGLGACFTKSSL